MIFTGTERGPHQNINISLVFQAGRDKLYLIKKLKQGMHFSLDPITTD